MTHARSIPEALGGRFVLFLLRVDETAKQHNLPQNEFP